MTNPPDSPSRYSDIARILRDELVAGRFGTDGKLPSDSQLVRRFEVSRPTVAKAMKLLSDEGLVERKAGSGSFARAVAKTVAKNNWLALIAPNLGNTEIFQVIGGEIASLARMHDFSLVWGSSESQTNPTSSQEDLETLCRQFIDRNVGGIFFAPYELVEEADTVNQTMAVMLRDAGIPVVLLDRDVTRFPIRSEFDLVGIDNFAGGYLLAEHLLKLGCKRIRFVARPRSSSTVGGRIAGVREAMAQYRIIPEPDWVRMGLLDDRKFIRSLSSPSLPDAFVCANDHTAALLMRELQRNQIRVPEDVRVVGFDDLKFATLVSPALTTIRQPCREIAQTAFRALLDRQADATLPARNHSLTPSLVIRDSCGAYLPKAPGKGR